jgi:hypothetical protein
VSWPNPVPGLPDAQRHGLAGDRVGWWPGNTDYPRAAFYAYAHPAPSGFAHADLSPGRWDMNLSEFVLDWDAVFATPDPHATALTFARSVARHDCALCDWDQTLASSLEGQPAPAN